MFPRWRLQRAWRMGEQLKTISGEMDITAWDALLLEVRRSAYRVSWVDQRINKILEKERELQHESDGGGELANLDSDLRKWMAESRRERTILARVSRYAIDAGLAEAVVRGLEIQAEGMSRALSAALNAEGIELDENQRRNAARAFITTIEEVSFAPLGELEAEEPT